MRSRRSARNGRALGADGSGARCTRLIGCRAPGSASASTRTSVDVEAEAIGHDLRFGTSTFAKDAPESTRQGDSWEAPSAPGDEWSTPGVTDAGVAADAATAEWPVASVPTEEPRPLELAGVEAPF